MKIGEVARRAGLAPSAIRYYEKSGLLPSPSRVSRQREYESIILGRLSIIRLAREAGFTVRETRLFLSGFSAGAAPATRWQTMARKKLAEIDAAIARNRAMKRLIEASFRCACPEIEDCERALLQSQKYGKGVGCIGSKGRPRTKGPTLEGLKIRLKSHRS